MNLLYWKLLNCPKSTSSALSCDKIEPTNYCGHPFHCAALFFLFSIHKINNELANCALLISFCWPKLIWKACQRNCIWSKAGDIYLLNFQIDIINNNWIDAKHHQMAFRSVLVHLPEILEELFETPGQMKVLQI